MNTDPIPDSIIMDIEEYLRLATKKATAMRTELADLRRQLRQAEAARGIHVWTPCSVRMPTEEDADCHGNVWALSGGVVGAAPAWSIANAGTMSMRETPTTHWTPTGLRRPEPPQPE